MTSEFSAFLKELLGALGVQAEFPHQQSEIDTARQFLHQLNKFLYQRDKELGNDYISRFHKYWERNHEAILGLSIDDAQCLRLAKILEPVYAQPQDYPQYLTKPPITREGISDRAVANVRFFTAIQDFKINIHKGGRNPFGQFKEHPEWFSAADLVENSGLVGDFLQYLEATGSQGDKRRKWMIAAAKFLIEEFDGDAYNILAACDRDAGTIRDKLASAGYLGYSYKKADMFLRDMAEWGVWHYTENAHLVDVASDSNTMRIALRTSIIKTKIPLLASYLDVYCYQYSAVDTRAANAWRRVWESWADIPNNHRPPTPASMDFLLYYSVGKQICRPTPKCNICPFDPVCPSETRHLNPPKSISQ
ncbi:MAG: hypothetical protein H8E40_12085, partial [Chloroflexi bacterium]|nr:hypothetical protein [Chloroflexota bacterium]